MTRKELHKLLTEIGGGEPVGQEAEATRRKMEEDCLISLNEHYAGCLLLGDAIHQFYVDTIREASDRLTKETVQSLIMFLHWHVLSVSRYFAAYDLFRRGSYFESTSLARTLWETALTMAAIQKGKATIEEVFGGRPEAGKTISPREIINRVKRVDSFIQRSLLWKNPDLNEPAKHALNIFMGLMNAATHKSNLGLALNIGRMLKGQAVPIFPRFDPKQTEMAWNTLFLATWSLMVTLSYLRPLLPEHGTPWDIRFNKMLLAFSELVKTPSNSVVQGFGEVVNRVFVL